MFFCLFVCFLLPSTCGSCHSSHSQVMVTPRPLPMLPPPLPPTLKSHTFHLPCSTSWSTGCTDKTPSTQPALCMPRSAAYLLLHHQKQNIFNQLYKDPHIYTLHQLTHTHTFLCTCKCNFLPLLKSAQPPFLVLFYDRLWHFVPQNHLFLINVVEHNFTINE